jgi:hypothetical protein
MAFDPIESLFGGMAKLGPAGDSHTAIAPCGSVKRRAGIDALKSRWRRRFESSADSSNRTLFDLAMPWDRCLAHVPRI